MTKITDDLRKVAEDVDILKSAEKNGNQGNDEPERNCDATVGNIDNVKENLLAEAVRRYVLLDDGECKTQRLKDMFSDADISGEFPEELFEKSTDAVVLDEDGSVGIVLMNGQEIR